ncbi:MAG TPA: hypothetical protein VLT87_14155, partial [Thermoanaerobaculia bacterium]|nr:hypothetical protein [Thermoanaerobaculia bacterium]
WMDNAAQVYGTPEVPSLFFNPLKDETPGEPASESIAWDAFPRFLTRWFRDDDEPDEKRWRAAETLRPLRINGRALRRVDEQGVLREELQLFYRQQDEYCEWHVDRDGAGRITRICFSSEAPEYWEFLAEGTRPFFAVGDPRRDLVAGDLGLVEELYREHVSPEASAADLVWPFDVAFFEDDPNPQTGEPFGWRFYARKGTYNPFNKWTTTDGIMHLTHPANTLRGEFRVGGGASVQRRDGNGQAVVDPEQLVCCSGFGDPNRSSDPNIGAAVNGFARAGLSVSLADPVGLYISELALDGFLGPEGEEMAAAWQVDRGSGEDRRILRARFEVPAELGFTVDQVRLDGDGIRFGGQIADRIQMVLTGIAKQLVAGPVALRACIGQCCPHPEKGEIEHLFGRAVSCADLPPEAWAEVAPVLPEEAPAPSGELAAADFVEGAAGAVTAEPEAKGGLGSQLGR